MSNRIHQGSKIISGLTDVDVQAVPSVVEQNASLSENVIRTTENLVSSGIQSEWPLWAKATAEQLEKILQLPKGWDSYGGASVEFENAGYAVRLLDFVMGNATPAPFIAPTSGGSVQLEWHRDGIDLEIEILCPYRLLVSYEDQTGATSPWEGEVTIDLTKVRETIQELSRRSQPEH